MEQIAPPRPTRHRHFDSPEIQAKTSRSFLQTSKFSFAKEPSLRGNLLRPLQDLLTSSFSETNLALRNPKTLKVHAYMYYIPWPDITKLLNYYKTLNALQYRTKHQSPNQRRLTRTSERKNPKPETRRPSTLALFYPKSWSLKPKFSTLQVLIPSSPTLKSPRSL